MSHNFTITFRLGGMPPVDPTWLDANRLDSPGLTIHGEADAFH